MKKRPRASLRSLKNETEMCACVRDIYRVQMHGFTYTRHLKAMHSYRRNNCQSQQQVVLLSFLFVHSLINRIYRVRNEKNSMKFNAFSVRI